jgi:hypothetical protein
VQRLIDEGPGSAFADLLDRFEVGAMLTRANAVVAEVCSPTTTRRTHRYPWPLV